MAHEIVGISGTSASGKNTAAGFLEEHGYMHVDTGSIVTAEAQRLYGSTELHLIRQAAHDLRQRLGAAATTVSALQMYDERRDDYEGLVVSGLRAVEPASAVQRMGGLLIFLDAPIDKRYENFTKRDHPAKQDWDFDEFRLFEEEEYSGSLSTGQNLAAIREMSDVFIYNDGELGTYLEQLRIAVQL